MGSDRLISCKKFRKEERVQATKVINNLKMSVIQSKLSLET